jgi:hypothetical protein
VVVIDTGIDYTHPDLAANMGVDADGNYGLNAAYGNADPMDDHYHGTHVAGTIGAVGNNGTGVVGVNWNVKLLACKFFDAFGNATVEGAVECLDYVREMRAEMKIHRHCTTPSPRNAMPAFYSSLARATAA